MSKRSSNTSIQAMEPNQSSGMGGLDTIDTSKPYLERHSNL
jgi:hypothetical protein